jgi:hypothetical protein
LADNCIMDCSILNQTTCQPVHPKQMQVDQEEISLDLWNQNGCYNSSLVKATKEYSNFEMVGNVSGCFCCTHFKRRSFS